MNFDFASPQRILFGPGLLKQAGPMARGLGNRALVVTGRGTRLADLAVRFAASKRSGADGSALVLVTEAHDFVVEGLFLSGGDSAGLFVRESNAGKILRNLWSLRRSYSRKTP